jgi:predicted HAD superfamily hydrolase
MTRPTVSYDVFDTVVTRAFAHPRDVFVYLGLKLREQKLCQIDPFAFARARWRAELAARKLSPWTEVLLDDIYRVLAEQLGWDTMTVARVRDLELEIESRHLRGVPYLQPRLAQDRAEAGRLLFLSDMYLPSAELRLWLEREGVTRPGDLLFISGEMRGNKSSGALFAIARDKCSGDFRQWRHAGDHAFADVEKPRQLGIKATHLPHAHLTRREQAARGTDGEFAQPARSLLAGAMRLARLERPPADDRETVLWETGTSVAGPLFYGFVRWTLAEARRRGLHRLYFLARDGQIFWRVAQAIQQVRPKDIECIYLHASRLVFAGPAELTTPDAMRQLVAPTGHFHSLRQMLIQAGLELEWAQRELPEEFRSLPFEANLSPGVREALADWILAPAQRPALLAAVENRARKARAYLDAMGLRAGEPVAIVDAGWLGSIQRNLERIIGSDGIPSALMGFYLGLLPPQRPLPVGEQLGYTNQFWPLPLQREESHKVLIELMAQSDHGQVIGFRQGTNGWEPELNPPGPINLTEIQMFQESVLTFTRRMITAEKTAMASDRDFARIAISLYRNFHDHPTEQEARIFGFLPHADQLLEEQHASLCTEASLREIVSMLRDYRKRPPHWWIGGQAALGHSNFLRSFRKAKALYWRLTGRRE